MAALKNVKHEKFCLHYAKTGNATESYKIAGYKPKSEESAYANANRLIKNDKVQARLAELAEEAATSKIADIAEILYNLDRIADGCIGIAEEAVE